MTRKFNGSIKYKGHTIEPGAFRYTKPGKWSPIAYMSYNEGSYFKAVSLQWKEEFNSKKDAIKYGIKQSKLKIGRRSL